MCNMDINFSPIHFSRTTGFYLLLICFFCLGCEGPVEPIRQNSRDPNYFLGQNIPSPATEFRYESSMPGRVTFFWKDNSSFEEGFVIERGVNLDSVFTDFDTVAPNTMVYEDNRITVSLDTLLYRVRSHYESRRSFSSDTLFFAYPFDLIGGNYTLIGMHPTQKRALINDGLRLLMWQPGMVPNFYTVDESRFRPRAVFDAASNLVVICDCQGGMLSLMDLAPSGNMNTLWEIPSPIRTGHIKIFSQAQRIVVHNNDNLLIWSTNSPDRLASKFDLDANILTDVTYDNAGRLWTVQRPDAASSSENFQLHEWVIQGDTLAPVRQFDLNPSPGIAGSIASFSAAGQRLATYSTSTGVQEVCIWDVGTGSLIKCISTGPEPVEILGVQMDIAAARIAMILRFGEQGPVTARIQDIASEQVVIQVNASTAISRDLGHAVL